MNLTATVGRFEPLLGWANRILRIDLSNATVHVQPAAPWLPHTLGGRGLAAALAWDGYPDPLDPLGPANPLMVVPGALGGSHSPYSGRTSVCGFSPQG